MDKVCKQVSKDGDGAKMKTLRWSVRTTGQTDRLTWGKGAKGTICIAQCVAFGGIAAKCSNFP